MEVYRSAWHSDTSSKETIWSYMVYWSWWTGWQLMGRSPFMNLVVLHQSGVVFPILQVLYIYMTAFFFKWTIFYLVKLKNSSWDLASGCIVTCWKLLFRCLVAPDWCSWPQVSHNLAFHFHSNKLTFYSLFICPKHVFTSIDMGFSSL